MSALLQHLDRAHRALLDGQPQDCAAALADFEAAFEQAEPEPDVAQRCRQRLDGLGRLTKAALEGVADARACIDSAIAGAARLDTYDREGRREERRIHSGRERRY